MSKGKLYLIPTPLGDEVLHTIPEYVQERARGLRFFVVERSKTARAFLKAIGTPVPMPELVLFELNEHTPANANLSEMLAPLTAGHDVGLLSEAGCPAVADPGAVLVAAAHAGGFEVVPLVGPSSILLALMASGFNGQNFAFVGYLPAKGGERVAAIKRTEQTAMRLHQTQIFIETPYRGASLFTDLLSTLAPSTCLAIGRNLTLPNEYIASRSVKEWREITKNNTDPHLAVEAWQHSPAIFLVDAG